MEGERQEKESPTKKSRRVPGEMVEAPAENRHTTERGAAGACS